MDVEAATLTGSVTGTCTSTSVYQIALDIDTRGCGVIGKLLLVINNTTAATKTLHYKIDGYASSNSSYFVPIKAATSINAVTQVNQTDVDKGYARVVVSVKGNSHADPTYQIDYTTY